MLNTLLNGIFDTAGTAVITMGSFLICIVVSLLIGLLLALAYTYRTRYTKSFLLTLAILPMLVCVVIMMVNGNIGTGVAVAGAFSLVRFRSNPGTAKEIGALFGAMATGLITGMGYLGYGLIFALIICLVMLIYERLDLGTKKNSGRYKVLTVTIPESLNYSEVFDDIFDKYLESRELSSVKTTNMGSLYKLTYQVTEKDTALEKDMIDELRTRNGNLEIAVSQQANTISEL